MFVIFIVYRKSSSCILPIFGILDNLSEILESMKNLSINNVNKSGIFPKLFYIYDNNKKKIIFIGVIRGIEIINGKRYKYVSKLLKRPYTHHAGTTAIYHILNNLDDIYQGICLLSELSSIKFYNKLKFINGEEYRFLNRNKINTLLPSVIPNTEFISQFDKIY